MTQTEVVLFSLVLSNDVGTLHQCWYMCMLLLPLCGQRVESAKQRNGDEAFRVAGADYNRE